MASIEGRLNRVISDLSCRHACTILNNSRAMGLSRAGFAHDDPLYRHTRRDHSIAVVSGEPFHPDEYDSLIMKWAPLSKWSHFFMRQTMSCVDAADVTIIFHPDDDLGEKNAIVGYAICRNWAPHLQSLEKHRAIKVSCFEGSGIVDIYRFKGHKRCITISHISEESMTILANYLIEIQATSAYFAITCPFVCGDDFPGLFISLLKRVKAN